MSEKRFILNLMKKPSEIEMDGKMISKYDVVRLLNELFEENEQLRQQLQEYKENWDDMVELATKTSLRNIELDEQIGQLRKELNDCEKFRYTVFKRMGELNDE